jgi:ribosomal protein L37AE/L43A
MKPFNNIKHLFTNTILCIKYPFLYPRNRFTDDHYTNMWLHNKIYKLNRKYKLSMSISIMSKQKYLEHLKKYANHEITAGISKSFTYSDRLVCIFKNKEEFEINAKYKGETIYSHRYDIGEFLKGTSLTYEDIDSVQFCVREITYYNCTEKKIMPNIVLICKDGVNLNKPSYNFNTVKVTLRKYITQEIKILEKINAFLGWFHILPSYTELDGLAEGWRKAFGKDICKELKHSLIHTFLNQDKPSTIWGKIKAYVKGIKLLYSYRILQIKEKFGGLRWYTNVDTEDTMRIVSQYEDISEHTCIVCGDKATYRSTGWICPYCDKHKPEGSIKMDEKYKNEY